MLGVEDLHEVFAWRTLAFRISIREMGHELGVLRELRVQILDGQFVVVWNLDESNVGLLEKLLLACQDLLEEVFVDHGLVREIKLDCTEGETEAKWHLRCWSR